MKLIPTLWTYGTVQIKMYEIVSIKFTFSTLIPNIRRSIQKKISFISHLESL